jgi:hypothetical protein
MMGIGSTSITISASPWFYNRLLEYLSKVGKMEDIDSCNVTINFFQFQNPGNKFPVL